MGIKIVILHILGNEHLEELVGVDVAGLLAHGHLCNHRLGR